MFLMACSLSQVWSRPTGATPPTLSRNCRLAAGSVAFHPAFTGSTGNVVDAIVRGYDVTILR